MCDDVAAGAKRTAADAELSANVAKRPEGGKLLADLTPLDCRIVVRASSVLSKHFGDRFVHNNKLGEALLTLSIADQASMMLTLCDDDANVVIVYNLLKLLATIDLMLFNVKDRLLMFHFYGQPFQWAFFNVICTITDPKILNATDFDGEGLLNWAVRSLHEPAIEWLISHDVGITVYNDGSSLFEKITQNEDDHPAEDYCPIIALLNRARQFRPTLFDPNQVIGGRTALGHFSDNCDWKRVTTTWLMAMDSDLYVAPGETLDEDLLPFDMTFDTYQTAVDDLHHESDYRFAQLVQGGIQLRGHTKLLFKAIKYRRADIVREFARQKIDFHCYIDHQTDNLPPFRLFPFAALCYWRRYEYLAIEQSEIASIIIANGGMPSAHDIDNGAIPPQVMAIITGSSSMLRYMVNHGFDMVMSYSPNKWTSPMSLLELAFFPIYKYSVDEHVVQILLDGGLSGIIDDHFIRVLDRTHQSENIAPSLIRVANTCTGRWRQRILDIALQYCCYYGDAKAATDVLNDGACCSPQTFIYATKHGNDAILKLLVQRTPSLAGQFTKIASTIDEIASATLAQTPAKP